MRRYGRSQRPPSLGKRGQARSTLFALVYRRQNRTQSRANPSHGGCLLLTTMKLPWLLHDKQLSRLRLRTQSATTLLVRLLAISTAEGSWLRAKWHIPERDTALHSCLAGFMWLDCTQQSACHSPDSHRAPFQRYQNTAAGWLMLSPQHPSTLHRLRSRWRPLEVRAR